MKGDEDSMPGVFRQHKVEISQTSFVPPDFTQVDSNVDELFERLSSDEFEKQSSIVQATEAHVRFVSIHPFADGNGRVARLLANYYLWKKRLPGITLYSENRDRYYDALEECNSKEVTGKRGDITDLAIIFCDGFEDALESIEGTLLEDREESIELEVVAESGPRATNNAFDKLLSKLSEKSIALDYDGQYKNWSHGFSALQADLKILVDKLDRQLEITQGERIYIRHYPIIDKDTYLAIRKRERFSRTWFAKIMIGSKMVSEEIVFYFGPNSKAASDDVAALKNTCSLHISRFDVQNSKHVQVRLDDWTSVLEIVHDGVDIGVLYRDAKSGVCSVYFDEKSNVGEWFGVLITDLLDKLLLKDEKNVMKGRQ